MMNFEFDNDNRNRYNARIMVIGVGGAGGNAINNMISSNLDGVNMVVANTDCQDLERSLCGTKIQLGPESTRGLGAGADPELGKAAAEESLKEIQENLNNCDMVFIAAGMGGGTGTGAAPIIAREVKAKGVLTVAVVTKPFKYEGEKRMKRALEGIDALQKEVDSLIVVPNEKLRHIGGKSATIKDLLTKADQVLLQAVKGISDLIMSEGFINLDFADVKKVMAKNGTAIMGIGRGTGENRTMDATKNAINSPLLEDISIENAKGVLMSISGPDTMTMDEVSEASSFIENSIKSDTDIFWGLVFDNSMGEEVQVTIVATGITSEEAELRLSYTSSPTKKIITLTDRSMPSVSVPPAQEAPATAATAINIMNRGEEKLRNATPDEIDEGWTVKRNGVDLDDPTFLRQKHDLSDSMKPPKKRGLMDKLKNNLDIPAFQRLGLD